ncbi:MAG: SDR family NAD(P)-dependent oxidoreductase [Isosphaeraceae bacterium]|nr:SDR family NAD(P)-dependent oxidoreductase [Isosphaeraceae bacterium]
MRSKGRIVLITGGSSGIGAALALEFGRRGADVGLVARRAAALEEVSAQVRGLGVRSESVAADVGDPEATRAAIERLAGSLGPIDLLVANAGIGRSQPAEEFTFDAFEETIRVNLLGAAAAIEAVLPAMLDRGRGSITVVGSLAAYRGLPQSAAYCASKAALASMMDALRPELRRRGIRLTTVQPGFVTTPMIAGAAHPRPFEMSAERAARIIADGIEGGRTKVEFPWAMVRLMRLVRDLPDFVYDRVVMRLTGLEPDASQRRVDG